MAEITGKARTRDDSEGRAGLASLAERALRTRSAQFAFFLLVALATRLWTLGDLDYQDDELLFFYGGQLMHHGLLPYVGFWDRKPPSLFLLYYLIAGISHSVLAYQLAALASAAATAFVVHRIGERLGGRTAGLIAGSLYLAAMLEFGGGGGQAPVFYNLPMALAAWLLLQARGSLRAGVVDRRSYAAMALAGLAISFKQTAFFESAFFGCFALWQLHRAGARPPRLLAHALAFAAIGAAPMLAWSAFYAATGHFAEFWHAMVTANLTKTYAPSGDLQRRAGVFAIALAPLALIALAGLTRRFGAAADDDRAFIAGCLLAAFAGFVAVPNLIDHYALPLLVPLAAAAAGFLARGGARLLLGIGIAAIYLGHVPVLDFGRGARSRAEVLDLVRKIETRDPRLRLFVYDGPVYLYALTGSRPPTPLFFPLHLSAAIERNTSHLSTLGEVRKILRWRPTTVILRDWDVPADHYNAETRALVTAYVRRSCRGHFRHRLHDMYGDVDLEVYTGCAAG